MKKNIFMWIFVVFTSNPLFSIESKITQMIIGPSFDDPRLGDINYDGPEKKFIYCVTEDNQLYSASVETPNLRSKASILDYDRKRIEGRIVLIGQPVIVGKDWQMPAVIKKKGVLGNFLRPDIYSITYDKQDKKFYISKEYEGHRTKVVKVGIVNQNNEFIMMSGSEWPTIKEKNITPQPTNNPVIVEKKNTYLFDINEHTDYQASAKKSFFGKNKWTFTLNVNNSNETITMPHLPNITFNPTLITIQPKTDLLAAALKKYKSSKLDKEDYFFYTSNDDYVSAKISFNKKELESEHYKNNDISKNTKKMDNVYIITACTFDFDNNTLFYATYSKTSTLAEIEKIELEEKESIQEQGEPVARDAPNESDGE